MLFCYKGMDQKQHKSKHIIYLQLSLIHTLFLHGVYNNIYDNNDSNDNNNNNNNNKHDDDIDDDNDFDNDNTDPDDDHDDDDDDDDTYQLGMINMNKSYIC